MHAFYLSVEEKYFQMKKKPSEQGYRKLAGVNCKPKKGKYIQLVVFSIMLTFSSQCDDGIYREKGADGYAYVRACIQIGEKKVFNCTLYMQNM